MKHVDEMSVFRFCVAIAVMFILGFFLSSLIKWEDCQMFSETSFFGTKYECKVKQ